jgi:hypothetical protein
MRTEALVALSRRGEELRYVTEHFRDLQGLRSAPFWAGLLALSYVAMTHPLSRWHYAMLALAIVFVSFGWLIWSARWYRSRYGAVTNPEPRVPSGIISIMHPEPPPQRAMGSGYAAVNFVLLFLWIVPMLFERFHRRENQFGLLILTLIVLPRCFHAVPASGPIRMRRALAIIGTVAVLVTDLNFLFARVGKWTNLAVVCATLLLLDLYDHWLLTRLLRGGSVEAQNE